MSFTTLNVLCKVLRRKNSSSTLLGSVSGALSTKDKLKGEIAHDFYQYLCAQDFTQKYKEADSGAYISF